MKKKTDKEIPPAPDMDPMLGDKTPAYVEWVRDNDPAEFKSRYSGRTTHLGYHPVED